MNTISRAAIALDRKGCVAAGIDRTISKSPWTRLRTRLMARQIGALRFVYYAFWDHCFVTLCAEPLVTGRSLGTISEFQRALLIRSFKRWMACSHPEWRDGPDAGGVLDWDLRTNVHRHRHWGYRLHLVKSADIGTE
jgi:hypothetical protein